MARTSSPPTRCCRTCDGSASTTLRPRRRRLRRRQTASRHRLQTRTFSVPPVCFLAHRRRRAPQSRSAGNGETMYTGLPLQFTATYSSWKRGAVVSARLRRLQARRHPPIHRFLVHPLSRHHHHLLTRHHHASIRFTRDSISPSKVQIGSVRTHPHQSQLRAT